MEIMPQIRQILKKTNCKLSDFYGNFQQVAKNIERFWVYFLLSYLVCSQIWLNHLMEYCHFSYVRKLKKNSFALRITQHMQVMGSKGLKDNATCKSWVQKGSKITPHASLIEHVYFSYLPVRTSRTCRVQKGCKKAHAKMSTQQSLMRGY